MDESRRRGVTRVATVAIATLVLIYLANLSQLVVADRRARAVEARLAESVAHDEAAIRALEAQTAYALTDAAAERFAREEKDWIKPGDHAVLVVPVEEEAVAAPAGSPGEAQGPGAWERLVRWLKGE
jgi:hypothetical protein